MKQSAFKEAVAREKRLILTGYVLFFAAGCIFTWLVMHIW